MQNSAALAAALGLSMLFTGSAQAALWTYTVEGTVDGELDSVSFAGAAYTITATADDANFVDSPGLPVFDPLDSLVISIAGFADATVTPSAGLVVFESLDAVAFGVDGFSDVFDFDVPDGLVLRSVFTDVAGSSVALPGFIDIPTDQGLLTLRAPDSDVTFSSSVEETAVPVPAAGGLLAAALGGIALLRRRAA